MVTKRTFQDVDEAPPSVAAAPPAARKEIRALKSPEKKRRTHDKSQQHENRCLSLYQQGLERINAEMAIWARQIQPLLAQIHSGPPITLEHLAYEYLRASNQLKDRYRPDHGHVVTCGSDDCLQLGASAFDATASPRLVKALKGVTSISCGGLHNIVIRQDGSVATWGCNDYGSLGRETKFDTEEQTPTTVTGFNPSKHCAVAESYANEDKSIVQVVAGENHSLSLSSTGRVYMMGSYRYDDGSLFREKRPPDDETQDKARQGVTDEATGQQTKIVVDMDIRGRHFIPTHIYQLEDKVNSIACGATTSAALLENGDIVTSGIGCHGEMGRSATLAQKNDQGEYELAKLIPHKPHKPEKPKKPEGKEVTKEKLQQYDVDLRQYEKDMLQYPIDLKAYKEALVVFEKTFLKPHPALWAGPPMKRTVLGLACGGFHMLVVARRQGEFESSVYTCGLNNYGQLGHGDKIDRHELTRVEALDGHNISKVDGGLHHSLCLDNTGKEVYAFGRSDYGQIGNTDTIPEEGAWEALPQRVPFPAKDAPFSFRQIACGDHHNCVLTDRGDVYTWGFGDTSGALGHGRETDEYRPRKVNVMRNTEGQGIVRMVDGGGQHTGMILTRL